MDHDNPFENQYGVGYQQQPYQQPYQYPFSSGYAAAGDPNQSYDPFASTGLTGVQQSPMAGLAPAGVNIAAYDPFAQAANDAQYQGLVPLTNTTGALGNTSTTTGYTNTLNPATGAITGQLNNVVGQGTNVPTAGYSTLPPSTTSGATSGQVGGSTTTTGGGYTNTSNTGTTSGSTGTGGGSVPGSGYSNGNQNYDYQSFWDPSSFTRGYTQAMVQAGINPMSSSPAAQLARNDQYRAYADWLAQALQGGTANNDTQSFIRNWISTGGKSNAASGLAQTLMPLFQAYDKGQLDPSDWRSGYIAELVNNPSYAANLLGNVGLRTPGSRYLPSYLQNLASVNQVQGQTSALPYLQALLSAAGAR